MSTLRTVAREYPSMPPSFGTAVESRFARRPCLAAASLVAVAASMTAARYGRRPCLQNRSNFRPATRPGVQELLGPSGLAAALRAADAC